MAALGSGHPGQPPGKVIGGCLGPLTYSGDKRDLNHISSEVQIRSGPRAGFKESGAGQVLGFSPGAVCSSLEIHRLLGWCQGAGKRPGASPGSVSVRRGHGPDPQGERPSPQLGRVWEPMAWPWGLWSHTWIWASALGVDLCVLHLNLELAGVFMTEDGLTHRPKQVTWPSPNSRRDGLHPLMGKLKSCISKADATGLGRICGYCSHLPELLSFFF